MSPSPPAPVSPLQLMQRIWPLALIVLVLMLTASISLSLVSAVRAFVAGESLWSKAQKDAIYYLSRYVDSGSSRDLKLFRQAMRIPAGDWDARVAMDDNPPRIADAQAAIVVGGNHPDDVQALTLLIKYLRDVAWLQEPYRHWAVGQQYLNQLSQLAAEIEQGHALGHVSAESAATWKREIEQINLGVSPVAQQFSASLGRSSRQLVLWLQGIHLLLAVILILLAAWHTRRILLQRQQFKNDLFTEKERAQTTLASLSDAVITTDVRGIVDYANPAALDLLGCMDAQLRGEPLSRELHFNSIDASQTAEGLLAQLLSGQALREEQTRWLRRTDHSVVPVKLMGAAITNHGQRSGAVIVLRDVSREQQYLDQLSWHASHDSLTGLENRAEFERRLQRLLNMGQHRQHASALLHIDLDQFKLVNETCGHPAGDEMLCEVCRLLLHSLRETDTLARLGGDEFGVLLENCPPEAAVQIAEKLRAAVESLHVQWGQQTLRTGLSIGLVHLAGDVHSAQELLRMADMACYRAKERGRNRVYIYRSDNGEYTRHVSDMEWVARIRSALEQDRFCLYAHTLAPLQLDDPTGLHFEVLLRLRDEQGKIVAPSSFVPAAERYGIMPAVDRWVIARTIAILAAHPTMLRHVDTCAINLSAASLDDDGLLGFVQAQLSMHGIAPQLLCFEITETSAIASLSGAARLIQSLRTLGCRFALDDFGVGMSSLTYLKQLPVDYLKIDGEFVRDMLHDPTVHAMVEMIHRIGHILGKRTVAEYVASSETAQALQSIGVNYAQGFAVAPPVPLDAEYFEGGAQAVLRRWQGTLAAHAGSSA
ncbi:EAL domain-containing protein [Delftia sp. PS-11]|uniref:EAL domain-containing protein n=1 Tax=Delftia sp. PS-11 TaxID=2767222 RepID=UPI00245577CE|nr:EAL domain-containing protein [Delftia sp. PS-11]KAJ8740783.1 EAL domain-containing protein [Delftia sp. PS-11]